MTAAELLPALHDLKAGRLSIDQLIAACSSPHQPLSQMLVATPPIPLATAADDTQATTDHVPSTDDADHGGDELPAPAAGGQYVPMCLFARGGMGQVWLARDSLGRQVAFKDIRPERAAQTHAIGRFLREAELTAHLEHPGVVPVYSAGTKADGKPFYAMRLIRGRTLSEAIRSVHDSGVDYASLPFRELLNSFVAICNAVAFAHSKGIIHRDLKPANVMVGDFGEVQVMDWGLAKNVARGTAETGGAHANSVDDTDAGTTRAGAVMGSPAYMAPEQAAGQTEQQDERTDVYGLGAILYEILTGKPPFGVFDAFDPNRRSPEPRQIKPRIPKSLDAICRKAIATRASARYATAAALANDVRHWLSDEPILARRDPFHERVLRWMRRHRTLVTSALAVFLVTIVSLAVGLGAVTRVNRKLDEANSQLTSTNSDLKTANANLETARQAADARRKDAEHARDQFDRMFTILVDTLRKQDPTIDKPVLTLVGRLIQSAELVNEDKSLDASTRVRLLSAIGQTFTGLGRPKDALQAHKLAANIARSLPPNDSLARASLNNLAIAELEAGNTKEAIRLLEELHGSARRTFGRESPESLDATGNYANALVEAGEAPRAVPLFEEILQRRQARAPDDTRTLMTMSDLGNALYASDRPLEAIPVLEEAYRRIKANRGTDDPETLIVAGNLGTAYTAANQFQKAVPLLDDTLARSRKRMGPNHPRTVTIMHNLAVALFRVARAADAVELYREALKHREAALGKDNPDTLITLGNLGAALIDAEQPTEGVKYLEESERRLVELLGGDNPRAIRAGLETAVGHRAVGDYKRSAEVCERIMRRLSSLVPESDPLDIDTRFHAAMAYYLNGQYEKARPLFAHHLVHVERILKTRQSRRVSETMGLLADCHLKLGDLDAAEPLIKECIETRNKISPNLWPYHAAMSLQGELLLARKKPDEAEPVLTAAFAEMKKHEKAIPTLERWYLLSAASRLVKLYEVKGDAEKTAEWKKVEAGLRGKK